MVDSTHGSKIRYCSSISLKPSVILTALLLFLGLCSAQDCDDVFDDFASGAFIVFAARCPGESLFDVARYEQYPEIAKPDGSNDFLATANSQRRCFKNSNPISVVEDSRLSITLYKTPGEILCTITILDDDENIIIDDTQVNIRDNIWSNYSYIMAKEENIIVEFSCDFIDSPRLAIDYIGIERRCKTTTPQPTTAVTSTTKTTTPPSSTTVTSTKITTTGTTTPIITTLSTTPVSTTSDTTTPTDGCKVIRDDLSSGYFVFFTSTCDTEEPFEVKKYSDNPDIPKPQDSNDFFAGETSAIYNCVQSNSGIRPSSDTKLHIIFYTRYLPKCLYNILDMAGTTLDSISINETATDGWSDILIDLKYTEEIFIQIKCSGASNSAVAIDRIEILEDCASSTTITTLSTSLA